MVETLGLLLSLAAGFILLLAGRRVFWLFAGLLGFFVGFKLAVLFLGDQSGLWPLLIALASGALGSILVVKLQKIAIGIIGFLAGGYILSLAAQAILTQIPAVIPWIIGGILGVALMKFLFNWALILFSAAIGSVILAQAIPFMEGLVWIKILVLFIAGVIIQSLQKSVQRNRL